MSYSNTLRDIVAGTGIILSPVTGTGANAVNISATLGLLNYGFFTSTATQNNPVASTTNFATYDTTGPANGVSIVGGSAITVVNAGTYTKLFTVNITKTSGGTSTIDFWLQLNGVNVGGSKQRLNLTNTLSQFYTSGNFTLNIPAGGSVRLCWSSADTTVSLLSLPAGVAPVSPTGNSVKLTLTRIS